MNEGGSVSARRLLTSVAETVRDALRQKPRVTVAIDGPDAAGKTTFADPLAELLPGLAFRASIDGFHNPRDERLRRGSLSGEGYFRDSFNYPALRSGLLDPFRRGSPEITHSVFDHQVDQEATVFKSNVPAEVALLFDGVFLLCPELRDEWDLSVYLHVPEEETLRRAVIRDESLFGSIDEVRRRYTERYLPGQTLYREECDPMAVATIVIDNTMPDRPVILAWRLAAHRPA